MSTNQERTFLGQPRGLKTLFFTEMWERFSYYGMRSLLMLFMVASTQAGGLGFSVGKAGIIYGVYTSSVYLLGLPGGWIADRFLGQRRAVLFGGVLIMIGHVLLAVPVLTTFYLGLVSIMLGTGLLKPNISAMVGQLYKPGEDARRDAGFSIFYMGINTGGFLAPLVCGFLAQSDTFRGIMTNAGLDPSHAWHFGFGAAAVGMFFGLVQYFLGGRSLGEAGKTVVPAVSPAAAAKEKKILFAILGAIFGLPALVGILAASGVVNVTAERLGDWIGVLLVLLVAGTFAGLFLIGKWTAAERKRLLVVVVLFFGAAVFWACFEQAGSTLNVFAEQHTQRDFLGITIQASYFQSLNSLYIIVLAAAFAGLWVYLAKRGKEPSSPAKFAIAMVLVAAGFAVMIPAAVIVGQGGKSSAAFLVVLYLIHTLAELCLSPVGLSSMTKLAPARIGGMVMGIWFMAAAFGNYVSGRAAGMLETMPLTKFFIIFTFVPLAAGLILFALVGPIRRMLAARNADEPAGEGAGAKAHGH